MKNEMQESLQIWRDGFVERNRIERLKELFDGIDSHMVVWNGYVNQAELEAWCSDRPGTIYKRIREHDVLFTSDDVIASEAAMTFEGAEVWRKRE